MSVYQGGTVHQKSASAPAEVSFDPEDEAETYLLLMARKWIDDR
jgi:hypothetical protein